MSSVIAPSPGTSTGASRAKAKAGTLSKRDGAVGGDEGFHQAAGALDGDAGLARLPRHDSPIHRPAAERDHRMAAHGGIALVMDEEHGEIGARQIGLDRQHAIHVEMPARLEHQQPAQMIQMLAGMAPLGEDGGARDRRIARR